MQLGQVENQNIPCILQLPEYVHLLDLILLDPKIKGLCCLVLFALLWRFQRKEGAIWSYLSSAEKRHQKASFPRPPLVLPNLDLPSLPIQNSGNFLFPLNSSNWCPLVKRVSVSFKHQRNCSTSSDAPSVKLKSPEFSGGSSFPIALR